MYPEKILAHCDMPPKRVNLIYGLYTGTENAVGCDGTNSDYFSVNNGVRQRRVFAPTNFNVGNSMIWRIFSRFIIDNVR